MVPFHQPLIRGTEILRWDEGWHVHTFPELYGETILEMLSESFECCGWVRHEVDILEVDIWIIGSGRGVIYNPIGKSSCVVKKGATTRNHIIIWEVKDQGWVELDVGLGVEFVCDFTWVWLDVGINQRNSCISVWDCYYCILLSNAFKDWNAKTRDMHATHWTGFHQIDPNCILFSTYYFTSFGRITNR